MSKSRAYCFTLNNYTEEEYLEISNIECKYMVIGKEVGESGTPHLQGYINLENPRSLASLKKSMKRAHIEVAKGSPLQASQYCKKDGNFIEKGNLPAQGKRTDLEEIREMVDAGSGMREMVDKAKSYQSIRSAELILKYKEKKRDWKPEVVWVCGASGTGKTRWAYDNYPHEDIHKQPASETKWFEGYDAHPVVIIDEVDMDTSYSTLKELTDRYPMKVHNKGGMRSFLARVIVLTSLQTPQNLFCSKPENGKEMLRRIDKIIQTPI